jgi:hypothetical protein
MTRRISVTSLGLIAACVSALGGSAIARDSFVYDVVGAWVVRTTPAESSFCFAEVEYDGGTRLEIGFEHVAAGLYFLIDDAAWRRLDEGSSVPVAISFDGTPFRKLTATVVSSASAESEAGIRIAIPPEIEASFAQSFMAGTGMEIAAFNSEGLHLSLEGSRAATDRLALCQGEMATADRSAPFVRLGIPAPE